MAARVLLPLQSERGAAAVEMALVLPILVTLLFGMVTFGLMYNTQIALTGAAREGARYMAINNDSACVTGARQKVVNSAGTTPQLTCADVSVTPEVCAPGADVTVTATRAFTYNVPFVPAGTRLVTGKAVMKCGG